MIKKKITILFDFNENSFIQLESFFINNAVMKEYVVLNVYFTFIYGSWKFIQPLKANVMNDDNQLALS